MIKKNTAKDSSRRKPWAIDKTPEIYCAIAIALEKETDISSAVDSLRQIGVYNYEVCCPKCESRVYLTIAEVKNEPFWYLDEALAKMFSQVENRLPNLKEIIKAFHGEVLIDVAFYQYGTYPALIFSGENMKKIRYLEADISIDPF